MEAGVSQATLVADTLDTRRRWVNKQGPGHIVEHHPGHENVQEGPSVH